MIVMDCEGNALELHKIDQLHCMYLLNTETGEMSGYSNRGTDNPIVDGLRQLSPDSTLVGHNLIWWDLPVLEKLYGFKFEGTIIDTLLLSRLLNPDRVKPMDYVGKHGPHSIAVWSHRLGKPPKIEIENWDQLTDDMMQRCKEDVQTTWEVYKALLRDAHG